MFTPAVLNVLKLLSVCPGGVSRQEVLQQLSGSAPHGEGAWVEKALDRLLELGVVEARGDLVVPLPQVHPLLQKMERLASRINRRGRQRDQNMDLIQLIIRGK